MRCFLSFSNLLSSLGALGCCFEKCFKFASTDRSSTLGPDDELQISIRSYIPVVDCEPRPYAAPSEADCEAVLATVPAYYKQMAFGTTEDWRTVPGRLPREFYISAYLKLA